MPREEGFAMRFIRLAILACAAIAWPVHADVWPSKPVRLIVPFPPGGSTDVAARVIADKLSQAFGQRFIVENRGGAGGVVGTTDAARAEPDGYTILFAANQVSTMHLVVKGIKYDFLHDFVPITQVTTQPNAIAVHPSIGVKDLPGLIALAKSKPNQLSWAHPGPGSAQQMNGELLWRKAGVKMTGVPYKGGGQAVVDLIAGHVQVALLGATPFMTNHKAGKIRIIAFTSPKRFSVLPDIPTLQEMGYEGVNSTQWLGLLAPRGTSPEIVERLHAETVKALALPDVREHLEQAALEPVGNSPQQFADVIQHEIGYWTDVAHQLGIEPQ
jgi:tripartite-type tricarboxylate transporter receptor subunit TctC